MVDNWDRIDDVLYKLLRYREVLGAVALSREGLVVGAAGVSRVDVERVGALGASLVGAAERTARRLGAGVADDISVNTSDGMLHLRSGGDFAVLLLSDRCDTLAAGAVCETAVTEIAEILALV